MSYAPLSDRFDDHPRYVELGCAEMGLIACAITYATRNLTDGRIPRVWPDRRFGREGPRVAIRLIDFGVWSKREDGDYEIVGFLDHNPSKAEVLLKKEKLREAGRKGGSVSRGQASTQAMASANPQAMAEQTLEAFSSTLGKSLSLSDHDHVTAAQRDKRSQKGPQAAPAPGAREGSSGKTSAKADDIQAVFAAWVAARRDHHPAGSTPKLDVGRRKAIADRLREGHDVPTLVRAVEGIWRSAWHRGENDRRQSYTDLTLALRDAEHVERFAAVADSQTDLRARPRQVVELFGESARPPEPEPTPEARAETSAALAKAAAAFDASITARAAK